MYIQMFNGWYFFWLILSLGSTVGLYFLLKNRSKKTQKIVLFVLLVLGLVAHFTKFLYPPYSTDQARMLRDAWFVNICGANIGLFPFMFISKSDKAKDYMFYLGMLGGLISVFYPMEPMLKVNQAAEWIDIVRFYFHHTMLYAVPLVMVLLKLHTLNYKRVLWCPVYLLGVMLFIMLNQVFQSELGFIPMRGDDILHINYKNSSLIWGPDGYSFAVIFTAVCPKIFKTIPFGQFAGQTKYWPWFWLIVPAFLYVTPVCFLMCMIFDHKRFAADYNRFNAKIRSAFAPNNQTNLAQNLNEQTLNSVDPQAAASKHTILSTISQAAEAPVPAHPAQTEQPSPTQVKTTPVAPITSTQPTLLVINAIERRQRNKN